MPPKKTLCAFCKKRYSTVSIPVGKKKIPICGTKECRQAYEKRKKMSVDWRQALAEYQRKQLKQQQPRKKLPLSEYLAASPTQTPSEREIMQQFVAAIKKLDEDYIDSKAHNDQSTVKNNESNDQGKETSELTTHSDGSKNFFLGFAWQAFLENHVNQVLNALSESLGKKHELMTNKLIMIPKTRKLRRDQRNHIKPDFTITTEDEIIFIDAKLRIENIKPKDLTYLHYFPNSRLIFITFDPNDNTSQTGQKRFVETISRCVKQYNENLAKDQGIIKPLSHEDIMKRISWYGLNNLNLDDEAIDSKTLTELAADLENEIIPFSTECPSCNRCDFKFKKSFINHIWAHENDVFCPICGKSEFKTKNTFLDHIILW